MNANTDRLEAARACWNAGDLDGYLTLYDPSIRLHGNGPEPMDKGAVTAFYRAMWGSLAADGRPNPELVFHETLAEGDLVSCRFTMRGVHRGEFNAIPATGRPYALEGITILRFADGRVVERWTTTDFLGLLVQLGAIPAPS